MRESFIKLVNEGALPFARICARFGISRKTGYKWLNRFRAEGEAGLLERARTPKSQPRRTAPEIEALVDEIRRQHPSWKGGRIRSELLRRRVTPVPAVTTIDAICRRLEQIGSETRSDRAAPNDCWELAIGPASPSGGVNHRAFVLRDRATDFVLAAEVVAERGEEGCRDVLWRAFARFGLPRRLRWPISEANDGLAMHTPLTVAVLKLGVGIDFFLPEPVATADPADRGWRDLDARLATLPGGEDVRARLHTARANRPSLARLPNEALPRWRGRLAAWADRHNVPGSVDAGIGATSSPAARYRPSSRRLDEATAAQLDVEAQSGRAVRRVSEKGLIHLDGRRWLVGRAFAGEVVEVRVLPEPDRVAVDFAGQALGLASLARDGEEAWALPLEPLAAWGERAR